MECRHLDVDFKPNTIDPKNALCRACGVGWRLWISPPDEKGSTFGRWYATTPDGGPYIPPPITPFIWENSPWYFKRKDEDLAKDFENLERRKLIVRILRMQDELMELAFQEFSQLSKTSNPIANRTNPPPKTSRVRNS